MPADDSALEEQIARARRQISSDSYQMSIGELTNLYREGELVISPAFQRYFRWDMDQKSSLVESILLGIPIPSIFVSQRDDGKWELVDGLQRVSTLLELQGHLLDANGSPLPALRLRGTKYLPALDGRYWEAQREQESLTQAQRLDIKRAKMDMKIIKRESSEATKYDLFQRLNSYGTPLTPQEMRSALLVSVNAAFVDWLEDLIQGQAFRDTTALSDRLLIEKYDAELALRFMILHNRQNITQQSLSNFTQQLDDEAVGLAARYPEGQATLSDVFTNTFAYLNEEGGSDIFRKWDVAKGKFVGGFLNTAFEVIAMGTAYRYANGLPVRPDPLVAARDLWARPDMGTRFATGLSTEQRLARVLPLGRDLMAAP